MYLKPEDAAILRLRRWFESDPSNSCFGSWTDVLAPLMAYDEQAEKLARIRELILGPDSASSALWKIQELVGLGPAAHSEDE